MRIEFLGDAALLLHFGERIDASLNARVHAVAQALREAQLVGVRDIVPAYASVALHYDPGIWNDPSADENPGERFALRLSSIVDKAAFSTNAIVSPVTEIPVCYDGEFGLDLAAVAEHAQLDPHEIVARHSAAEYRVAMLGFAPGFPYLLGLDSKLHAPRRANPRTRVPAGSIAIGGAQTGIYPCELPGGWQIIGRTPLRLFDPGRTPSALLAPGQRVRFRAIAIDEFTQMRQHG